MNDLLALLPDLLLTLAAFGPNATANGSYYAHLTGFFTPAEHKAIPLATLISYFILSKLAEGSARSRSLGSPGLKSHAGAEAAQFCLPGCSRSLEVLAGEPAQAKVCKEHFLQISGFLQNLLGRGGKQKLLRLLRLLLKLLQERGRILLESRRFP